MVNWLLASLLLCFMILQGFFPFFSISALQKRATDNIRRSEEMVI